MPDYELEKEREEGVWERQEGIESFYITHGYCAECSIVIVLPMNQSLTLSLYCPVVGCTGCSVASQPDL